MTKKLYYTEPKKLIAKSNWQSDKEPKQIILETSPAYPEGGGQIGDSGTVEQNGKMIKFLDTKKIGTGRKISRDDFPAITVGQNVALILEQEVPSEWDPQEPVIVSVDANKRHSLSRSHTAAHLLWLALGDSYGDLYSKVRGCHIVETRGRFDLLIKKPTNDELREIEAIIQKWVLADHAIEVVTLPDEPECRIWRSAGEDIPCGGTHLESTKGVGSLHLKAKNKGKSGIRVIYELID